MMYLRDLVRSLLRRWYLLIVALAAVGWLSVNVYAMVPPTFEARANVLLLPPERNLEPGDNPFLALGGLEQPLEVLQQLLDADATRDDLLASMPRSTYTVVEDGSTNSPILLIEGIAASDTDALAALDTILAAVPTTLREMQERLDVAPASQVRSIELTADDEAKPDNSDQIRAFLAVAALGTALATLLIGAIDSMALARKRRKAARTAAVVSALKPLIPSDEAESPPDGPGETTSTDSAEASGAETPSEPGDDDDTTGDQAAAAADADARDTADGEEADGAEPEKPATPHGDTPVEETSEPIGATPS